MSSRFRAVFCALTACVLSACGGGSDWTAVDPQADAFAAANPAADQFYVLQGSTEAATSMSTLQGYTFSSRPAEFATFGGISVGYIPMSSDAVNLNFGHVEGDATKFFLSAEVPGSQTIYECISAAWSAADKTAIQTEFGYVPPTCDNRISYTSATGLLVLDKATIPGTNSQKLVLKIRTNVLPLVFPAAAPASGT